MNALRAIACIFGSCVAAATAGATTLQVQLLPRTGEIRLRNESSLPATLVYFSIESPAGRLTSSGSVWRSISNNYDAPIGASPGNGLIDPNGEWVEIEASSMELTEGALDADGGRLLGLRAVSLGRIWNATTTVDLLFDGRDIDEQPINFAAELALDGDYNKNGRVDAADYVVWRNTLNASVAAYSVADGNGNGLVEMTDYSVWRSNFGASLATAIAFAAATPEPPTTVLLVLGTIAVGGRLTRA